MICSITRNGCSLVGEGLEAGGNVRAFAGSVVFYNHVLKPCGHIGVD